MKKYISSKYTYIPFNVLQCFSRETLIDLYMQECISPFLHIKTFDDLCHLLSKHIVDSIFSALKED